jgi:DNA-binding transcriptional ArsR family regulator
LSAASLRPSKTKSTRTRSNSPVMFRCVSKDMHSEYEVMIARARVLSCLTRIDVWCTVGEIGMYPSDIATTIGISPATVTHHLRVLHDAGLVQFEQQGRHRLYRVTGERWGVVSEAELEQGEVA